MNRAGKEAISKVFKVYSSKQASKVSGLSPYMLDYLCRTQLICPSGSCVRGRGRARQYTFSDIVLLRIIARLLRHGLSIQQFRKTLLAAKGRAERLRQLLVRRYLVTDGKNVYLEDAGVLQRLDNGQLAFAFVVDLEPIRHELSQKLIPASSEIAVNA